MGESIYHYKTDKSINYSVKAGIIKDKIIG